MSALGQKQTFSDVRAMSALPPKAEISFLIFFRSPVGFYGNESAALQTNSRN
jgi:hypothetical protein